MKKKWIISDYILSPIGGSSEVNFNSLVEGKSGLKKISRNNFDFEVFASCFSDDQLDSLLDNAFFSSLTRFEKLLYYPVAKVVTESGIDVRSPRTLFIIATTKGNIELIENSGFDPKQLTLYYSAQKLCSHFGNPNKPWIVSNACISGITAQIIAFRMLDSGQYDTVIVCGADTVNSFVLEGFNSLKALSPGPCRPFDRDRQGINLGEAGAAMILSIDKRDTWGKSAIELRGGAVTNDANHISGPSRTGLELSMAIDNALNQAGLSAGEIDFVSAHGTGTVFNDEMEAKAIHHSGLGLKPVNSLKGYFGHTLGVAGILESIITVHSLRNNLFIASKGYENSGTSMPLNVMKHHLEKPFSNCIKTMAGFGGCNAALSFSKS